jgi:hypothetical protein
VSLVLPATADKKKLKALQASSVFGVSLPFLSYPVVNYFVHVYVNIQL